MLRAANFIRKNYNQHQWYGVLSTFKYEPSRNLDISGGIDLRTYNGQVFSRIHDLLGADLWLSSANQNRISNTPVFEGDTIIQNIERQIRWAGAFALFEYKGGNWSAFLNISSSTSFYKQYNYFLKKELEVGDTTLLIGYNDNITYNGTTYNRNSEGLKTNQSDWVHLTGFTVKGGMNYNITEKMNAFFNVGYLNRAPLMQYVIRSDNKPFQKVDNELIQSAEVGYSFRDKKFAVNANAYYTIWQNRPTSVSFTLNGEPVSSNATGMGALHKGVEFDFIYKFHKKLEMEGMVSIGDWRWNKVATAIAIDDAGNPMDTVRFDPRGVRVGDAAQQSYALSFRYMPFKGFYFKPQFTWFAQNYANYTPDGLVITDLVNNLGPNVGRQSWRMPDYGLLDVNLGYKLELKKYRIDFRLSLLNALDVFAITDAQSNQFGNSATFNGGSSSVNFLMGRRWLSSVTLTL